MDEEAHGMETSNESKKNIATAINRAGILISS
jgi:hypothetical protein